MQHQHTPNYRKHNSSLCLLTTFVYWLAELTQRAGLLFLRKMPLLGFSVFYCPLCLSLILSFMEGGMGGCHSLPLSHDCCRVAAKVTCLPIQTVAPDWIGFFNRGNYHSLGWLLEQSSKSHQPGCKTGARRMCFSQLQLYYLSYKWQVQEMTNADGDKLICWIGLD